MAGIGIGQLADYMIDDKLASGALVALLPQRISARSGLYMYYQQRTQMPARATGVLILWWGSSPRRYISEGGANREVR